VRIADEYLEALIAADYPSSLLRFVLAVVRETWGWREMERNLTRPTWWSNMGLFSQDT